jgi:hypothetical protein
MDSRSMQRDSRTRESMPNAGSRPPLAASFKRGMRVRNFIVMPGPAGIQTRPHLLRLWVPAYAGTTSSKDFILIDAPR